MDVRPLVALDRAERFEVLSGIDRIFFEASNVQSFESPDKRVDFHWLWLGRYLIGEPHHAFVALSDGRVSGYLVGSLIDPSLRDAALGLDYYKAFARETARYPANLHVNVDVALRGRGIGEALVTAFESHVAERGVGGVHVVTGAGVRNVGFYARLGFHEVARTRRGPGHVVMLAKKLSG